jgi:hypothetical protein
MRQMTLQLKTRIQNVNIMSNNIEVPKIILRAMLLSLGGLAIFYVLILGNMVFNIVERKALEREALTLSNEVGDLELSYLAISSSVDMALSSSMGFKEAKTTFVTRKSLGSLKQASNEI